MTVHIVISPYVAEVAANPDKVASLSWRMVRMVAALCCAGSLGLLVFGPIMLSMVGPQYRSDGLGLLYLAAAFVPLSAISAIYEAFSRVTRKLGLMMIVLCVSTSLSVFGSIICTRMFGVVGVGWAYLAAESLSAALLIVPTVLWLRRNAGRSSI